MATLSDRLARSPLHRTLYHFTDTRNLDSIRRHGLLSVARLAEEGIAPEAPGGNIWSRTADARIGMDRYVHLCLLTEHPMEFRARGDGRIVRSVFIPVLAPILQRPGVLFAGRVANEGGARHLPLDRIEEHLDLHVVYDRTDWNDPAIRARRAIAKKYEILVPNHVPVELLRLPRG